jgi:N6-adenosine-specific RNA methylase IME4
MQYSTMTVDEITALPVDELVGTDAHLYLWTTNGFLPDAFEVARAWGFTYSTMLVWAKNPMGGGLGGAYGISTEFLLYCRRGSLPAVGRVTGTWWQWKRPYSQGGKPMHSAKPPAALDLVEQVSPGPYLELFSRAPRLGWDSWGYGHELLPST